MSRDKEERVQGKPNSGNPAYQVENVVLRCAQELKNHKMVHAFFLFTNACITNTMRQLRGLVVECRFAALKVLDSNPGWGAQEF